MNYKGQNLAILGCGRSGIAAARLALREGAKVTIFDSGDAHKLSAVADEMRSEGVGLALGQDALSAEVDGVDLAIISPGIALEWELPTRFAAAGVKIIGEMEFAFEFCSADIIGVTGTNGKTTTVELLERLLSGCGEPTIAAGNYGCPLSEVVCSEETYAAVALEVSSFQLEAIEAFRPQIAVWTNFAPDHLDRYSGIEAYRAAKLRLFENQSGADWAVVNHRDELGALTAQTVTFSAFEEAADYTYYKGKVVCAGTTLLDIEDTRLRGTHNAENLMAALAVGSIRGHQPEQMVSALEGYAAPAHRCELVATVDGVDYINDSKATNLHALESALVAFGTDDAEKVILIAGGKDKGLPFEQLADCVGRCAAHAILIGEIRQPLSDAWGAHVSCQTADDLELAVATAAELAGAGGIVLFAPGTSSFDMFSGYEARGEAFRQAVSNLNQQPTLR